MFDTTLEPKKGGRGALGALAPDLVAALLDHVPQAAFWIMDAAGRYVSVNAAMLELCGARSASEMIGRTARDFFAKTEAEHGTTHDANVLHAGLSAPHRLEFYSALRGQAAWLLTKRHLLLNEAGQVHGVIAIGRKLPSDRHHCYARLAFVIDYIHANYHSPLDICELARRCSISASQLNRDFASLMGSPPKRYLMKLRFEAALALLQSGRPVIEVAHACGYADQSAFARSFRQIVGVSPSEYRRTRT